MRVSEWTKPEFLKEVRIVKKKTADEKFDHAENLYALFGKACFIIENYERHKSRLEKEDRENDSSQGTMTHSENEGLVHYIVKKYKAVDAHTTAIA